MKRNEVVRNTIADFLPRRSTEVVLLTDQSALWASSGNPPFQSSPLAAIVHLFRHYSYPQSIEIHANLACRGSRPTTTAPGNVLHEIYEVIKSCISTSGS